MAISATVRRMEGGIRINADGLLTDEHGNSIAGVGSRSVTKNSFYVDASDGLDSNSGDANAPWKTLAQASRYATAGSTIYVLPGSYSDPVALDGVTWVFSRGAIVTAASSVIPLIQGTETQTVVSNLVIRGEGVFTGGIFFRNANKPTVNLEVEARAIYGVTELQYNQASEYCRFRFNNIFFGGSDNLVVGDSFVGSSGIDLAFNNCQFYSAKVSSDHPYVVIGCVSKVAQDLDTNEVGTFLINSALKNIPAP